MTAQLLGNQAIEENNSWACIHMAADFEFSMTAWLTSGRESLQTHARYGETTYSMKRVCGTESES